MPLTDEQTERLGRVLMGKLCDLGVQQKVKIAAKAGLDVSKVPNEQYNVPVNNALLKAFQELNREGKETALPVIAAEISGCNPEWKKELNELLKQHGYEYTDGVFVPAGLIDDREKPFLPQAASEQLSQAIRRLADGDENGAITSACGAIDTVTIGLYEKQGWGKPPDAFQAKVNTALGRLQVYEQMLEDLKQIGLRQEDAETIVGELREATKSATEALQVIRRTLGDVHGKRPTYTRLTYDTIKWASAICALFEGRA